MNLLNQIQSRIGKLRETKTYLIQTIASLSIESESYQQYLNHFYNTRYCIGLLESIIAESEPDEPKHEKFVPFTGLKERTPEENEKYHEELIENGLRGICGARNMTTRKYFMKLRQYFVNVTSLVWCAGLIEKLEEVEVILQQSIGEEENIIETQLKELVSKQLHEAYSQLEGLTDNCNILEKELNLNE
jgi:hypothetical protein